MARITLTAFTISTALLVLSASGHAQEVELSQCKKWDSKIDHLTDLRRSGGRAQQMEGWKRQRDAYERKFKDANCRKYGRKLRK